MEARGRRGVKPGGGQTARCRAGHLRASSSAVARARPPHAPGLACAGSLSQCSKRSRIRYAVAELPGPCLRFRVQQHQDGGVHQVLRPLRLELESQQVAQGHDTQVAAAPAFEARRRLPVNRHELRKNVERQALALALQASEAAVERITLQVTSGQARGLETDASFRQRKAGQQVHVARAPDETVSHDRETARQKTVVGPDGLGDPPGHADEAPGPPLMQTDPLGNGVPEARGLPRPRSAPHRSRSARASAGPPRDPPGERPRVARAGGGPLGRPPRPSPPARSARSRSEPARRAGDLAPRSSSGRSEPPRGFAGPGRSSLLRIAAGLRSLFECGERNPARTRGHPGGPAATRSGP